MKYLDEAQAIWRTQVPRSGQAKTVQGELVRACEKLRDEAQRNGNGNWDKGFVRLATWLRDTLLDAPEFDDAARREIDSDVGLILDYKRPVLDDELYDRLLDRIVEWCLARPEPVPRAQDPQLHR